MDKLVHAKLRGITATFRVPLVVSGNSLCAPVPSYATILGILGCCAGKLVYPEDIRIAFEYSFGRSCSHDGFGQDMETTHRLELKNNELRPHSKGTATRLYEFHSYPSLDLYVDNLAFLEYFNEPAGIPTFGRSQDVAWIESVRLVEVAKVESGIVGTTLMPFPQEGIGGRVLRLPEYFDSRRDGMTREPKNIRLFQVVSAGSFVTSPNLYQVSMNKDEKHSIYLHEWARIDGKE